jgi:hypothetical protein
MADVVIEGVLGKKVSVRVSLDNQATT